MRATLILLVLLASAMQAPPPPAPPRLPMRIFAAIPQTGDASIEGFVRRLDTGEPLAGAPVVLVGLPEEPGSPFAGAMSLRESMTDAAGRFLFEGLPASTYTLRITPANFFPPPIGGTSAPAVTASITVVGGQKVSNLAFSLVPGGVIRGLIRDDDGRPAGKISVWALRIAYRDGRKTLENAKSVQSDDRGEFRLSSLPPGEYYVRASGTVDGKPILAYYPGGSNVESAALIRVRAGDEIFADMPIPPAKLFRISGTVVNAIPELATEPQGFILMPRDRKLDDESATILPNLAIGKGSGYFEILALPGVYDLIPAARATGAGNFYYYTARVPVEVRDRDVEGISVAVTRGAELTIQVNARAAPSVSLPDLRLGLRPVDELPSPLRINLGARPVSPDGKVQFGVVPEGKYALVIPVPTPDVYIADIRQSLRSVYDQGEITVGKEAAEPVEVILSANGGRIEGTVEATDKTSGTVRVSLIPEGSRRDNLLLYRRASLVQGRFVLTDIPPGNYKLFAWEDLPVGADENSEFMSAYETRGRAVTVRAGAAVSDIALPLIRR
jgi:hypothetical protein